MEDLVARICDKVGLSDDVARSAIKIIMGFLNREGPSDSMQKILSAIPGASDFIDAGNDKSENGGTGGGLLGGLMGGGGAMAALNELTSAGLDMGQVRGVTKEIVDFAKEKAGDGVVEDVIGSIPGLGQLV